MNSVQWLIRAYNGFPKPASKISKDNLIKKARKQTGLTDLGNLNDHVLDTLCAAINSEARLHAFGTFMISEKLKSQLENRLWAEYWFKKYPEILQQPLKPVILITGLQRTGTTKMQRLLSRSAEVRSLLSWEALYPSPIQTENERDRRIGMTKRNARAVRWISPIFQKIHPIHCFEPEEDVLLLDNSFISSSFEAIMEVPAYSISLSSADHLEAYSYERDLLKLLQWQQNNDYWVLKSPHHLEHLFLFEKIFSPSNIIWMHRDPVTCVPSFLNMLYHSRLMFSDHVSKEAIKDHWLPKIQAMLSNGHEFRAGHSEVICDVFYQDFVGNEARTIEALGLPFEVPFESESYHSKHTYDLSDWSIDPAFLESIESLERKIK